MKLNYLYWFKIYYLFNNDIDVMQLPIRNTSKIPQPPTFNKYMGLGIDSLEDLTLEPHIKELKVKSLPVALVVFNESHKFCQKSYIKISITHSLKAIFQKINSSHKYFGP